MADDPSNAAWAPGFVTDFVKKHRWTSMAMLVGFASVVAAVAYFSHGGGASVDSHARDVIFGLFFSAFAVLIFGMIVVFRLVQQVMDASIRSDDAASAKFNTKMAAARAAPDDE